MREALRARRRRPWRLAVLVAILTAWTGTAVWHSNKPMPPGTNVDAPWQPVPVSSVRLIADVTTADGYGRPILNHAIFDEVLAIVRSAREFLVLDYFLFNDHKGSVEPGSAPLRPLSAELREALLERRREVPQIQILFITDPINDVYGGDPSQDLALLRDAGVQVVITDLDRLRDSNLIYSSLWRLTMSWWSGDGRGEGWLPNPFSAENSPVTLRAWARLANFKANHRKVILGDDGRGGLVGIVTSANPHDASSAHSNIAVRISGRALEPLLASELAIARFSGWQGELNLPATFAGELLPVRNPGSMATADPGFVRVKVLTERAIRTAVLERVGAAARGEAIDIAMFYLSDRAIIESLLAASRRGVAVRLILDPNKDAFGRAKSGIPNRPVASELVAASDGAIRVRWYRTHGEQFHTKLVMVRGTDTTWMTLGSANLTRRNIGGYNLEANIAIEAPAGSPLALQAREYFDALWNNEAPPGVEYTADFGVYADPAQSRYWLYRILEGTGLSTF